MVDVIGRQLIITFAMWKEFAELCLKTLTRCVTPPFRIREFIDQLLFVGWASAPVVLFSVCFAAIVTIIESSFHMKLIIQNDALVPGFAAMLILRELGAVVTALLVTSRVGAGVAAEIGSMQVTEQVDALKMLGIDPIRYLVVPRFFGSIVGVMLITVMANLVCLYAAMEVTSVKLGYSPGIFLLGMRTFVGMKDLAFAAIKGAVFGAVIPVISCFYGFRCKAGAEGVGLATTNAVVSTSVSIIVIDFALSWVFSHYY